MNNQDLVRVGITCVMAVLIGVVVLFATLTFTGIALPAAVIAIVISGYSLYQLDTPSEVAGYGFYALALLILILPVSFLGLLFTEAGDMSIVSGLTAFIFFAFVAIVGAIVAAAIGRFFKKRAKPS